MHMQQHWYMWCKEGTVTDSQSETGFLTQQHADVCPQVRAHPEPERRLRHGSHPVSVARVRQLDPAGLLYVQAGAHHQVGALGANFAGAAAASCGQVGLGAAVAVWWAGHM